VDLDFAFKLWTSQPKHGRSAAHVPVGAQQRLAAGDSRNHLPHGRLFPDAIRDAGAMAQPPLIGISDDNEGYQDRMPSTTAVELANI
jgi:hypothetical protein